MGRVELEPFQDRHLERLQRLFEDPGVQRFTRVPVPVPAGYERMWLDLFEHGRQEGSREAFAIVDSRTREFLGIAVAPRIETRAQTVELGYVVAPEVRGLGVATDALRLLSEWALSALGAVRLELLIVVGNAASKQVAARCGFVREGVMRSLFWKEGAREDTELWSRLPSDPLPDYPGRSTTASGRRRATDERGAARR